LKNVSTGEEFGENSDDGGLKSGGLIYDQGLNEFGEHPDDDDKGHRSPEVVARRLQMIRGPDDVDGM